MREYIHTLRAKPEDVRKQIRFGLIVSSMFIVGSIWIYGLTDHSSKNEVASNDSITKPWTLFADSISSTYSNIKASVGNISFGDTSDASKHTTQIDLIPVAHSTNQ